MKISYISISYIIEKFGTWPKKDSPPLSYNIKIRLKYITTKKNWRKRVFSKTEKFQTRGKILRSTNRENTKNRELREAPT